MAQCPFADGLASALALGPAASVKLAPVLARDLLAMALGRAPVMIPLAGAPGSLALMNAADALPGYQALLPADTTFRNEVPARVAPAIIAYRPGRAAKKINFPILFCISNSDTVTPPAQTIRYARTAPRGEIKRYDAGHFDFYIDEAFEALVRDQVEFLTRQLHPAPASPSSDIEGTNHARETESHDNTKTPEAVGLSAAAEDLPTCRQGTRVALSAHTWTDRQ